MLLTAAVSYVFKCSTWVTGKISATIQRQAPCLMGWSHDLMEYPPPFQAHLVLDFLIAKLTELIRGAKSFRFKDGLPLAAQDIKHVMLKQINLRQFLFEVKKQLMIAMAKSPGKVPHPLRLLTWLIATIRDDISPFLSNLPNRSTWLTSFKEWTLNQNNWVKSSWYNFGGEPRREATVGSAKRKGGRGRNNSRKRSRGPGRGGYKQGGNGRTDSWRQHAGLTAPRAEPQYTITRGPPIAWLTSPATGSHSREIRH